MVPGYVNVDLRVEDYVAVVHRHVVVGQDLQAQNLEIRAGEKYVY
jgi:hypothetical protein